MAEEKDSTKVSLYLHGMGDLWKYVIREGTSIGLGEWNLPFLLKTTDDFYNYLDLHEIPDYLPERIVEEYEKPLAMDACRPLVLTIDADDFGIDIDDKELEEDKLELIKGLPVDDIISSFLESFANKDIAEKDLEQLLSKLPKKFSEDQNVINRLKEVVWGDAKSLGNDKKQFSEFVALVMGSYGNEYPLYCDCYVRSYAFHDRAKVYSSFTIELQPGQKFDLNKVQLLPYGKDRYSNRCSVDSIIYDGEIIYCDDFGYDEKQYDEFGRLSKGFFDDDELDDDWEMDEDDWNDNYECWLEDNEGESGDGSDKDNDHIAFFNSFKSAVDFGDKLKVNKPSKNEVGITCSEMGKIKLVSKRTKNDLCVIVYSYDEKERMERIHSSKNAEIESALSSFGELSYTATDKSAAFSIKKPLSDFADDDARFEWIKNVALTFRDLFVKYVAL